MVEAGPRDGLAVVMQHGTPSAGIPFPAHVQDAESKGIRLVAYDRPGYGHSTRHADYRFADTAADVTAIADALDLERLAVWGMSGGGPHALACAALLQGRVVAVGILASPAPYGAPGLDFFAGMGEANVEDFNLMLNDEAGAHARLPADREATLGMTAEMMVKAMASLMSPSDLASHTPEFAEWIVAGMHAGLVHDGEGWWDDSMAQVRPWGFEVDAIAVPVQLWHGTDDRFVPVGHGRWLAEHIPGVDAHIVEAEGHGTVVQKHLPQLHSWLVEHF